MKKILALSMLLMSAVVFVPSIEAKATENSAANMLAASQVRVQIGRGNQRRNNRRVVRTYVRNVRVGRQVYRETYRVTYRPNGTTKTQLISRVRVGRY